MIPLLTLQKPAQPHECLQSKVPFPWRAEEPVRCLPPTPLIALAHPPAAFMASCPASLACLSPDPRTPEPQTGATDGSVP